ncbi:hypothetical protein [Pinibacter soli]|uniref:Uncharacterized protein n=1 Tax=Pinibacter soli TaxID=3044211 RepID=A0ABT6R811_9BACT|nr:hypothetical protein [Pinibacter soli]MDI3318601.1 hypothetical protein [Pinibacter soli]
MKKKTLIASLLALIITISAFANPISNAQANFNKQFKQATNVNWSKVGEREKVCFTLDGRAVCAYYDTDGKLYSITRSLLSTELPLILSADLKQSYSDFWITNISEVANGEGTTYYATLENADHELVLKSTNISEWSVYQKFKKY